MTRACQIIFEAELVAVVVALHLWSNLLSGRPVVFYIDNNSARDGAISGSARTRVPARLVQALLHEESDASIVPWYARVPSPSNPSDRPSRELLTSWTWRGRQIPCWDPAGVLERLLVWLRQDPAVKWG